MLFINLVSCAVLTQLSSIKNKLYSVPIETSLSRINKLKQESESLAVAKLYDELMLLSGNYMAIIDKDKCNTQGLIHNLDTIHYTNKELCEEMYEKSPFNMKIFVAYLICLLRMRDFSKGMNILRVADVAWPEDEQILNFKVLLPLCKGDFTILNSFPNHFYTAKVRPLYKRFIDGTEKKGEYTNMYYYYQNIADIYDQVTYEIMADGVEPSIFSGLKVALLSELVDIGVKEKIKGSTKRARELYNIKRGDLEAYHLMICMLNDGLDIGSVNHQFTNKRLDEDIKTRVYYKRESERKKKEEEDKKEKAREAEARERKEQERRRQQGRYHQYGHQQGGSQGKNEDSKGYYKLFGLNKDATESEIKKKYRKLCKEKNPNKHVGNDPMYTKLSKEMMEINSAYETLSNSEKRKMYDSGMHGDQRYQFYQNGGGEDISDIFKAFFGGGGGFGSSGGGRTYHFRNGGF